jgi:hypothetical protein
MGNAWVQWSFKSTSFEVVEVGHIVHGYGVGHHGR